MHDSVSYILAASIKELFPGAEIEQIDRPNNVFLRSHVFRGIQPTMLPLLKRECGSGLRKNSTLMS